MPMKLSFAPRALAAAVLLAGLAGCASTSEIDSLKAEVAQAQATAEQARKEAEAARIAAEEAAKDAATASEKADRIYQQSLRKVK